VREPIVVRAFNRRTDEPWVRDLCHGETRMARKGELLDVLDQEGLVAECEGTASGLLAYRFDGAAYELFYLEAVAPWAGIGSALVEALLRLVGTGARVWVVTTNDNLDALRFYQRRGFHLREVRPGAVDDARHRLKPAIPPTGNYDIAIRDELELELTT
jgi:GNAT superfamily N-acetyltransferase